MLIEIIQDGAGAIEKNQTVANGFYTGGVQNCLVTVYQCVDAAVLVHDSGQLRLDDICNLITKFGTVTKITAAFSSQLNSAHHQNRLDRILRKIRYSPNDRIDVMQSQYNTFGFVYPFDGKPYITPNIAPEAVVPIPDKEKRGSVVELNNFFLEPNSQSLALDIQYIGGVYSEPRSLDLSLEEMITIIKRQRNYFFHNLAFLWKAHLCRVISMPPDLLKIAEENNVDRFTYQCLSREDETKQDNAFNKYMNQ